MEWWLDGQMDRRMKVKWKNTGREPQFLEASLSFQLPLITWPKT